MQDNILYFVSLSGPLNLSLYKHIGITHTDPFFFHNEKKIFALFDAPHLIKSVRNNLKNYDVSYIEFGKKNGKTLTASWHHIKEFYEQEKSQRFKTAPKLTDLHVNGKGLASMKVKLATQIFSNSVAAGISAYARGKLLKSKAIDTADFIGNMNELFDSVNSKSRFSSKRFASAVSDESGHIKFWEECVEWIKSWKFINYDKRKIVKPASQKGWIQTLNGLMGLWNDLKNDIGFMLTNRFNQDPLENTFSSVRSIGGFSDNPNCTQFRNSIQAIIVQNFMKKSASANCEEDSDFNLIELSKMDIKDVKKLYHEGESFLQEDNDFPKLSDKEIPTFTEIEENVLSFITGYLAKLFLKKFSCEQCNSLLVGSKILNMKNFFLYFKEYDIDSEFGLKWPTEDFYTYMCDISEVLFQNWNDYFYRPNVKKNLQMLLSKIPFTFFGEHEHKEVAKKMIIHCFVTMMIKHRVKNLNRTNYAPPTKKIKHVMNM